jgi:hypothetical protein
MKMSGCKANEPAYTGDLSRVMSNIYLTPRPRVPR